MVEDGADRHGQRPEHSLCKIIGLASNYWSFTSSMPTPYLSCVKAFLLLTYLLFQCYICHEGYDYLCLFICLSAGYTI